MYIRMKERREQTYVTPYIEVMSLEVEQCILAASIEELGDTMEEIDW